MTNMWAQSTYIQETACVIDAALTILFNKCLNEVVTPRGRNCNCFSDLQK